MNVVHDIDTNTRKIIQIIAKCFTDKDKSIIDIKCDYKLNVVLCDEYTPSIICNSHENPWYYWNVSNN